MPDTRRAFVFHNRRWLLAAIFVLGFGAYPLDRISVTEAGARFLSLRAGASPAFWMHLLLAIAALLVGLGAFWRTWGSAYLGADVVNDSRLHSERLVADGPYRLTRNPLYFGNLLMALGLGFVVSPPGWPVIVLGMWMLVRLLIRDEEAGLAATQGESYRAYLGAVPKLFSSFRPLVPAAGARPRWVQGICGEAFVWALTGVTAGMAVSLNPAWFQIRMFWAFTIALFLFLWARRRRAEAAPGDPPAAPPLAGRPAGG